MATTYNNIQVTVTGTFAISDNSSGTEILTTPAGTTHDGIQLIVDQTNNQITLWDANGHRKIFEQNADITITTTVE